MVYVMCDRNGQISFEESWRQGRLPLLSGPDALVRKAVEGTARLAYDGQTWLVPGVPEAAGSDAAVDAVLAYRPRLDAALRHAEAQGEG